MMIQNAKMDRDCAVVHRECGEFKVIDDALDFEHLALSKEAAAGLMTERIFPDHRNEHNHISGDGAKGQNHGANRRGIGIVIRGMVQIENTRFPLMDIRRDCCFHKKTQSESESEHSFKMNKH